MELNNIDFMLLTKMVQNLVPTALKCGSEIMKVYNTDFDIKKKADKSPVTKADIIAETIILDELGKLTPAIPIVAEEQCERKGLPDFKGTTFWCVDALDGTKEFIKRNGNFTVNIGLLVNGQPSLGIIYAPAHDKLYTGIQCAKTGRQEATLTANKKTMPIRTRKKPHAGITIVNSASHENKPALDEFITPLKVKENISIGSSIKFCWIAEGKADLYPRFGPTSEWDIAAGHAILLAAGGHLIRSNGKHMLYKKEKQRYLNDDFFASGQPWP